MPLIANTLRTLSAALVTAAILVAALVFEAVSCPWPWL